MELLSNRNLFAIAAVLDIATHSSATKARAANAIAAATASTMGPRYLEVMLQGLVHESILLSVRGPHGGFRLGLPASKISVADIIAGAETSLVYDKREPVLPKIVAKVVKRSIDGAGVPFLANLARLTVADLLERS
jgi:Rrf2 family protein